MPFEDDGGSLKQGFIRQRRNLIGISLALWFYVSSAPVIRKISFFGNEVDLADPGYAGTVLWVAWAYFGCRYFQHYMDLPNKGVEDAYLRRRSLLTNRFIRRNTALLRRLDPQTRMKKFRIYKKDKPRPLAIGEIMYSVDGPGDGEVTEIEISRFRGLLIAVQSALYVGLCTRFITEYYLPFIVALLPVVLLCWWNFSAVGRFFKWLLPAR